MNSRTNIFSTFSTLVDQYDSFIFDCDGVLWSGKSKFEEAFQTLEYLKSQRKNIFFLTNGSAKSREVLFKKIINLGFECKLEDVYPSSYLAVAYLKLHEPTVKKIYVVGRDGIVTEAKKAGFEVIGGPSDDDKELFTEEDFVELEVEDVDTILVGLDMHFNYYKLAYGSLCL
jgi:HAD superfamily hydrolase (TIGR01450 family)